MGYVSMGAISSSYENLVTACSPARDLSSNCAGDVCNALIYEHYLESIQCMYNSASQKFGSLTAMYTQIKQTEAQLQQVIVTSTSRSLASLAATQRELAKVVAKLADAVGGTIEPWQRILARWNNWLIGERSMMADLAEFRYTFTATQLTSEEQQIHDMYEKQLQSHNKFLFVAADSLRLIANEVGILGGLQKTIGSYNLQNEQALNNLRVGWQDTLDAWKRESSQNGGALQKLGSMLGVSDFVNTLVSIGVIVALGFAAYILLPPLLKKAAKKIES